jgi:hypothetical protein
VDDFRSDCILWAVHLGADEFDARWGLSWLDDEDIPTEIHDALTAAVAELSPASVGQYLAEGGGAGLRALLCDMADHILDARREGRRRALRAMPYREYLATPEWHARAEATYKRFGGRCALCNAPGDLQAHHRTYERRGEEELDDLTALCPGCHALFHEWRHLDTPLA